jgi:pyrroline-5-carboxylate reductase
VKQLGVIGVGVMGQALIQGLLKHHVLQPHQLWATARTEATCQQVRDQLGIQALREYTPLLADTDVLLLCVKPHQAIKLLQKLSADGLPAETLVISIAAGVSITQLEGALSGSNPVIRAMTNTPCLVGQGMTTICSGSHALPTHRMIAQRIFESVGKCLEMDETYFDAVTGLCGSGPAYMYLIMEALADGGVRVGLPRAKALQMVAQTVLGAATMVLESGKHPAALRDDVTTPAGCTIGALLTLEDGKIRSVLARAVEEATHIASGLGR